MSCRAKCSTIYLRKTEERVIAGDDDVAIADQSDAATDTESGNGSDDRNGAVVDGGKGGVATLVGADQRIETLGVLHLFDVNPSVEAAALSAQDDDAHLCVTTQGRDGVGDLEPFSHRQGVNGRTVHDDLGNAAVVDI